MPRFARTFVALCILFCLAFSPLLAAEPRADAGQKKATKGTDPQASQTPPQLRLQSEPDVKKAAQARFLRVQKDAKDEPLTLETSIVRYVPAAGDGGLVVDLIGVVHIGDRGYYEKLNKQFEQYDALLYELVAPQDTRPPKGGKREMDNPLAMIQMAMKTVLQLDSQMEVIDYTKKNFVHADLSFEQMGEAMRERGESGLTIALGIAADFLRQQNVQQRRQANEPARKQDSFGDIFNLLLDPEGGVKIKRLLARQFEDMEGAMGGLGGTLNTLLITDRNQAAMKVFQKELAKGKKKIAIFYGAAHMPDFEKRLLADFGLKRQSEEWLTAWDLRPGRAGSGGIDDLLKRLLR